MSALALTCACALVLGGCGSGDRASDDVGSVPTQAAGTLRHVDGTIAVEGTTITVTPKQGAALMLELGPAVELGPLRGLAESQVPTRVRYATEGGGRLVAASVEPAPRLGADLKTYTGIVVETTPDSLVIGGDEGDRTFVILPADQAQFEAEHMLEHRDSTEPILVYYRSAKGADRAVAYEDA